MKRNNLPGIAVFAYNRPKHFKKHFIILKNLNSKNLIFFYSVMVQKKNDFNVKEVHRIAKDLNHFNSKNLLEKKKSRSCKFFI